MSSFIYLIAGFYKMGGTTPFFDEKDLLVKDLNLGGFVLAAFLVGFGTKMGNGCTSGHGVCGLPRLSIRSLVAVCLFMFTGIAIATLRFHEPFLNNS